MDGASVTTEVRPFCVLITAHQGDVNGRWLFGGPSCPKASPDCSERGHVCERGGSVQHRLAREFDPMRVVADAREAGK